LVVGKEGAAAVSSSIRNGSGMTRPHGRASKTSTPKQSQRSMKLSIAAKRSTLFLILPQEFGESSPFFPRYVSNAPSSNHSHQQPNSRRERGGLRRGRASFVLYLKRKAYTTQNTGNPRYLISSSILPFKKKKKLQNNKYQFPFYLQASSLPPPRVASSKGFQSSL
jgi:hypothetical protein